MKFFIESRNFGLGLVFGGAIGAASTTIYYKKDLKKLLRKPPLSDLVKHLPFKIKTEETLKHPAMKYGVPTSGTQNIKFFNKFIASFDTRTRNPNWVLEYCTHKEYSEDDYPDRQKSQYFEDETLQIKFRNKLSDFKNSGYDRGHLAPAANHTGSQEEMNETFSLMNISPQLRDYWARFEKFVRNLTKTNDAVFVVSGPLWLPEKNSKGQYIVKYPMIGEPPCMVSVPTHFYKVILTERNKDGENVLDKFKNGDNCALAAFVMPNQGINENTPLLRFSVPISDLECATGFNFFPGYLTDQRRVALDKEALKWRNVGKEIEREYEKDKLEIKALEQSLQTPLLLSNSNAPTQTPTPKRDFKETKACLIQKAKTGSGAIHICHSATCDLPPPQWWVKKDKNS